MAQGRTQRRFTAKDVMEIVVNGESDVDIDITETDEESADEDYGTEANKENQLPSDQSHCPADIQPPQAAKRRDSYQWHKKDFISPNTDFSGAPLTEDVTSLYSPLHYFRQFVSEDMIDSLTTNTNVYSLQTRGSSVNTTAKEIEQMMGMYLNMGIVQMNGCRMYWEQRTRVPAVADVITTTIIHSVYCSGAK